MEMIRRRIESVNIGGKGPCGQGLKAQACKSQDELKRAAQCEYSLARRNTVITESCEKAGLDPDYVLPVMEAYKSYRPVDEFLEELF
jgi:hypothetical protein